MKYWLLTTEYPPLFGGGISTYCYHTARMLAAKGHEVTVFIPSDQTRDYTTSLENGVRIIRFSPSRTGMQSHLGFVPNQAYEFAAITRQLIRQEGKPDCIESQDYLAIAYYVLQFKLLLYPEFENVPVLLTLHSPAFLYLHYNREGIFSFPNYWTGEMEKSCLRAADWIIAPSEYILEETKKHAVIDDEKTSVIRNPYQFVVPSHAGQKIIRNKIIFYGKLSPQKGVFEMFAYLKTMWDQGFPHSVIVAGGTDKVYYPEMKTMGQIIRDQYEPYFRKHLVHIAGRIQPGNRDAYLMDAHVILVPSLNDNLPYAVIEAMSIGKIVLSSRQGGQKEIIDDGVDGFLFDHEHPETFAAKLNEILSLDDEQLERAGSAASRKIEGLLNYETIYAQKWKTIGQMVLPAQRPSQFPFVTDPYPFTGYPSCEAIKGLLSVVIPYYNMSTYIGDCIASVAASNYKNLEILVIDDGSDELQSEDVLRQIAKQPGIKILRKINEGVAKARNYGANLARGEYLAFLDADDRVDADLYSNAIRVLQHYPNISFVGCWVKYFGDSDNTWPTWNPEPPYILLHNSVNSSSLVYKKTALLHGGLFDREVDYGIEDYESVINMLEHGYRGVVLPESLFFYRVRTGSMFRALTKYKILYSTQYIAGKHADFYSKFATEIFSLLNANGPSFGYDNPSFEVHVTSVNSNPNGLVNRFKTIVKRMPFLKKLILRMAAIAKLRPS